MLFGIDITGMIIDLFDLVICDGDAYICVV